MLDFKLMFPNQFADSLWGDEAFSAVLSQKPLWQILKVVARDTSPPLYYIFEHFWFKVFGSSELAIRSLSFIFHLGTVITLFLLAKYLWDKKTAFLAAFLGFLIPFLFVYAFEGRMYAILVFTTTLSFYGFFRAFESQKTLPYWKVFYAFAATAALYSHHFSILAIFIQGLWALSLFFTKSHKVNWLKRLLSLIWPFLLILVLYLPWLPILYRQSSMVASGFWLGKPPLKDLFGTIAKFLVGSQSYPLQKLALALVAGVALVRRWQPKKRNDWILLSWFLGPLILTWLVSQLMQSIFFDRYMLFAIPGAILVLVSRRRKIASISGLVLLITIFIGVDWKYFTHPNKRPFREATAYIKQELKPGDRLINWNGAAHHLWEIKYYHLEAPIYSPGGPLPFYVGTAQMTENDVIFTPPDSPRLGVITSGPEEEVSLSGYQKIDSRQFGSIKIIWLEKKKTQ